MLLAELSADMLVGWLVGHSVGQPVGMQVRSAPTYDSLDLSSLLPNAFVVKCRISELGSDLGCIQ